jgi:hypothetical protein
MGMAIRGVVSYYMENVLNVRLMLRQTLIVRLLQISLLARVSYFLEIADWLLQHFSFSYL